eukprot:549616_1
MSTQNESTNPLMKYDKNIIINSIYSVFNETQIAALTNHINKSINKTDNEYSKQDEIIENKEEEEEDKNDEETDEDSDAILEANVAYMKKWGFRPSWQSIERSEVKKMIDLNTNDFVIIDVRTPQFDYYGGHIIESVNIPSNVFENKLPKTVMKYCGYKSVIIHCMYSQMRGPHCCNFYYNALQEICKNYKSKVETPIFQNSLHRLNKIYHKIDDIKYEQLYNQNIYLLNEGFSGWINECIKNSIQMTKYVSDYNKDSWQLDDDMLVHKLDWNTTDVITQDIESSTASDY